jgi:hypothetical protein
MDERKYQREESCLDDAALGYPVMGRPEFGMSVRQYYRLKHSGGAVGRFYPLHQQQSLADATERGPSRFRGGSR